MNIAVVGAGASGLMCSGFLAKNGFNVTLFEKRERVARKLLITGKGRCNITNNCTSEEFLENIPQNSRFLYSAIKAQSPQDTIDFFEDLGVKTKTERGNRVFPKSDKSLDVIDALFEFCYENGVNIKLQEPVLDISANTDEVFRLKTEKNTYNFDKIIIATGGVSYPQTGSTGDGYKFAEKFSHKIIKPSASLVALNAKDTQDLMGLSLKNVEITLFEGTKPIYKDFGEMLFTHFGVSGPLILSSSAHMKENQNYKISIDLKPALSKEELDKRLLKDFEKYNSKNLINGLVDLLPKKLIPVIIDRCQLDEFSKIHTINKKQRQKLCSVLKNFEVTITSKCSVDQAVITRGGVCVKEINPKNMESKKMPNLYFIGEILDVDGYTGGFNLQIAWSTAYLLAKSLEK